MWLKFQNSNREVEEGQTKFKRGYPNHPFTQIRGHICTQHTNPYAHLTRVPRCTILPLITKHNHNLCTHHTRVNCCTKWGLQHLNRNPLQTTLAFQPQHKIPTGPAISSQRHTNFTHPLPNTLALWHTFPFPLPYIQQPQFDIFHLL